MSDWVFTNTTEAGTGYNIRVDTALEQEYEVWCKNWQQEDAIIKQIWLAAEAWEDYLQKKRRGELRREERKKYPLFYLKDGIV